MAQRMFLRLFNIGFHKQVSVIRYAWKDSVPVNLGWPCFFFFGGLVSTQLAFRVQPKLTQVQEQYWGNPKVARLEGTPAILF